MVGRGTCWSENHLDGWRDRQHACTHTTTHLQDDVKKHDPIVSQFVSMFMEHDMSMPMLLESWLIELMLEVDEVIAELDEDVGDMDIPLIDVDDMFTVYWVWKGSEVATLSSCVQNHHLNQPPSNPPLLGVFFLSVESRASLRESLRTLRGCPCRCRRRRRGSLRMKKAPSAGQGRAPALRDQLPAVKLTTHRFRPGRRNWS